jgi:Meiotically Up-regulated Gene 113 (MUG113) protein
VVYFIQGDHSKLVKIGKTVNIVQRLNVLRGAGPDQLTVLAVIPNENDDHKYHERFADAWSHGEWFHPSPDLLAFIGRIPESEYTGLCIRVTNHQVRTDKAATAANQRKETRLALASRQQSFEALRTKERPEERVKERAKERAKERTNPLVRMEGQHEVRKVERLLVADDPMSLLRTRLTVAKALLRDREFEAALDVIKGEDDAWARETMEVLKHGDSHQDCAAEVDVL